MKFIHKIPLNNNGKIDKYNLLNCEIYRNKNEKILKNDSVANAVYEAWKETLGHESFDNDTNFFDAGGSSLAVLKLSKKLEMKVGRKLTVIDLYRFTTVNEIVSFLKNDTVDAKTSEERKKEFERISWEILNVKHQVFYDNLLMNWEDTYVD
ncbi:phosphopantetheine-binding protein [Bacillus cereus]